MLSFLILIVPLLATFSSTTPLSSFDCHTLGRKGGNTAHDRTCLFHNVCYSDGHYSYFLPPGTPTPPPIGMGVYTMSKTLEWAIADHPPNGTVWITEPSLVYDRCCDHNYMHGLLDAYLGVGWMIGHWMKGSDRRDVHCFWDDAKVGPPWFKSIAAALSPHTQSIPKSVCWNHLIVGPAQHQLGGPGQAIIVKEDVDQYASLLLQSVGAGKAKHRSSPNITIINRDKGKHRRIVNDRALAKALRNITHTASGKRIRKPPHVTISSFDSASFEDQVLKLASTDVMIGMHGAALANSIFMPANGVLVELLPYRVKRPLYRTITGKQGRRYLVWHNERSDRTTFYPDILSRVSDKERDDIQRDPISMTKSMLANRYWLDQDTKVDVGAVVKLVREALDSAYQ